jgi:NADH:ubiquinone reductase (non-electrogenic)
VVDFTSRGRSYTDSPYSRYAAELHDFLTEDLQNWYPEIAGNVKITLIEALPNVLPMFSKQLM